MLLRLAAAVVHAGVTAAIYEQQTGAQVEAGEQPISEVKTMQAYQSEELGYKGSLAELHLLIKRIRRVVAVVHPKMAQPDHMMRLEGWHKLEMVVMVCFQTFRA